MKETCIILTLAMACQLAWAVPAKRDIFSHKQKDGSELSLQPVGDESFHYFLNLATGEKMELGDDGDFRVISDTQFNARQRDGETRRQLMNQARLSRLPGFARQFNPDGPLKSIGSFNNMTGTKKGIVILVNFQDMTFASANDQSAFYNQFNQTGYNANGHIGSVKDYFSNQSYGNFTIDFDVVGPVTVSKNMSYYGGNDSSGSDAHPAEMIIEALQLADSEYSVDFSKYDWGGDGYVDQVFVIYAGYNEAQASSVYPDAIWPHEWDLASANYYGDGSGMQTIDGKYINTYACTSELSGSSGTTMDGIGTACHEFSHCLGYPDLYDTNGSTNGSAWGMDGFDLMDYGSYCGPNGHGEVPTGYSAYQRWMAGWLEPVELTAAVTVSEMAPLNDNPVAYIIYNDNNRNEYYLLENRQATGFFTYFRRNTNTNGMLISHVDYNSTSWGNNRVNTDASHQRFTYVAADGTYTSSSSLGDVFPGSGSVTAFTSTSHQDAAGTWFNANQAGTYLLNNQDVTNIALNGVNISFDFNGGTPPEAELVTPVIYYPHIAYLGTPFEAPKLTTNSAGTLTYSSSDPSIAEVDPATGAVTLKSVGRVFITVTQTAAGTFTEGSASYLIEVRSAK